MATRMAARPLIQIVFASGSLLAILFVGLLFDGAFAQAEYHLEARIQEGPPLPGLTEVFMEFGALSTLLLSLPWFVLLGVPLENVTPAGPTVRDRSRLPHFPATFPASASGLGKLAMSFFAVPSQTRRMLS